MKAFLKKLPNQTLTPDDQESADFVRKLKIGEVVSVEMVKPRNYPFLQKYIVMLTFAFDCWDAPENTYKGQEIEKDFKTFRENVQIIAGYGYPVVSIDGTTHMKSKSISFAKCTEEQFAVIYNNVLNVLLKKVLRNYTRADIDSVLAELMEFA